MKVLTFNETENVFGGVQENRSETSSLPGCNCRCWCVISNKPDKTAGRATGLTECTSVCRTIGCHFYDCL